jgi:hypothetical protein
MKRRCADIAAHLDADADLDALRAVRSRKEARARQREQMLAQQAELETRIRQIEPERARAYEVYMATDNEYQMGGRALRGIVDKLAVFALEDQQDDKTEEQVINRITGGE